MIMVSEKLLQELKQIVKEEYGVELVPKEVSSIGNSLVRFFEILIDTNTKYKYENYRSPNR